MELLEDSHSNLNPEILGDLHLYLDTLNHHLMSMRQNIQLLAPWLNLLSQLPAIFMHTGTPAAQAWQDFRDSLPVEIPQLNKAASVYSGIKTALSELQVQLNDSPGPAEEIRQGRAWCQKLDEDLSSARMALGLS